MKPGITLIEVAISILLASLLASVLFISFSQLQMASRITESFIEVDMRSAVVIHQMSQDIGGAFVPQLALIQTPTVQQPTPQPAATDTQKQITPLDMATVFRAQQKDKNLDMITCITNNPVAVYDTVKPRVARVVYHLVTDKEREGTFRLVRQEALDLQMKSFEKTGVEAIRAYELAHNIKSCTFTCTLLEYPEPTKEQQAQQKQGKEPEIIPITRTLNEWVYDPKKAKEQKMPPLPYAITIKCVFWDDQHRREWPVEFSIPIATFEPYSEKKKERRKKQQPASQPGSRQEQPQGGTATQRTNVTVQLKVPENVAKFLAKKGHKTS